jgi:sulfite reductase (NADPH) hemoprotein beta-component
MTEQKRSKNERLKEESRYLRGTIAEGLTRVETGAIVEEDTQLLKFHGSYMQDDRDVRGERSKKKLEKAYIFMVRLRIPGGLVTPQQWLALDRVAGVYANGTLRITTRATFQYHGIIKSNLKRAMQGINAAGIDTKAACGDVNRGVMSVANPYLSKAHREAYERAKDVSDYLVPRTGAYHEIWLDGQQVDADGKPLKTRDAKDDKEPIYGAHYLPRKFKIVFAVPPDNDIDVFAHDLGFIAIVEKGRIVGWNLSVGGGMGMTHGDPKTFPRTGDLMGFCSPDQVREVAETVVSVQRDWGDRENRAHARLKYTIEDRGLDAFRAEVERRLGYKLGEPRPFEFTSTGDVIGWRETDTRDTAKKGAAKRWHLTLFVENGRIKDRPGSTLRTALREIAELGNVDFVLTANQNVIIANATAKTKTAIEKILAANGVTATASSGLKRNSMACVALPTCGLALAESERFLPEVISALEDVLDKAGLKDDDIVIRMTGCPNGCARPYLAEIGLVGRNPGLYNLYLGAAFNGSRLNKLYAEDVNKEGIVRLLEPIIEHYANERQEGEHFGDFVIRNGYVQETAVSNRFHADVQLAKLAS